MISLIQTAEGALNETHAILQRMRELAVQASNDTNTLTDRKELQKEVNELLAEIDRIGGDTEFNTQKLLDGTFSSKSFHIGANENQVLTISIGSMKTDSLGDGTTNIESLKVKDVDDSSTSTGGLLDGAEAAITLIDKAIEQVSAQRSYLGANQNRLEHTINNLNTSSENLTAAESRIRDVDYALTA